MHFEMGKLVFSRPTAASCFIFLLLVSSGKLVAGGRVHYDKNDELLVSDGTSDSDHEEDSSFLHHHHHDLKEKEKEMEMDSSSCYQMYGFLPCSTNVVGNMFLIGVYDYFLYHGESFVSHDARDLLLGKGYRSAVIFQILDSLPEPLVLAASVALSKNEDVEEHLSIAVGFLVGSPILFLTTVWGYCKLLGSRKFDFEEISPNNIYSLRQRLTGFGVVTDSETSLRARFMLVSLIPLAFILIPMLCGVSSAYESLVLFVALLAAVICLFTYFLWQRLDGRILKRTREYTKFDRKMEMRVPFYEVQEFMRHINKHLMSAGIEMEKKIESNDHNMIMIGRGGLPLTFKQWFFQKIQSMEDPNSYKKFKQVAQLLREEKISLMKLITGMVTHDLLNDQTQRKLAMDRLFEEMDRDGNSSISPSELKCFLESKQKDKTVDEEVFEIIMTHLDVDGDGNIDLEEFKIGMTAWFWQIEQHYEFQNHETDHENGWITEAKEISLLIFGISLLIFLAEPLTHSVQVFSESANFSPLYISLILLPMVKHHRTARAAINEAAMKKRHHMISSTFSEIYHRVLMNNLMGFALLLCVMIYRGLTWHFSAEVLTLVIVCGIVGILAGFNSKFPNIWTFIITSIYPLSFAFFILVNIHFR